MTRAILFDMDGVLIDSMHVHAETWGEAFFHYLNIHVSKDFIFRCEGKHGAAVLNDVAETFQVDISKETGQAISHLKDELFAERFSIRAVPGAVELVHRVTDWGYRLGVATGSNHPVAEQALTDLGIRGCFSTIIAAEDVQFSKPNPQPYELLLAGLGSEPDQSFVIENAPLGVTAAQAAGLFCVGVQTTNTAETLQAANLISPGMGDLRSILEEEYARSQGKGPWLFS